MAEFEVNPNLHKICSGYIGTVVCVLGLIGNIFSVVVWRRINKKRSDSGKSAGLFLIVLAIVDSGLLVLFLCTESLQQLDKYVLQNAHYAIFYCYFGFPIFFFFIVASIWMVICVTCNRFVAVIFPHKAQRFNSPAVTYSLIGLTLFFAFAINLPHFFNYQPKRNGTGFEKTEYGKSNSAKMYDFWAHCMLLVLIPWFTILGLNSAIIYKLVTKRNIQLLKKGESRRERQTTIILMVITISFLIFLIWQCLTQCFWMLHYGENNKNTWFDIDSAYGFARLGVVVNSSVNFVLYCLSGTMFRKELKKVLNQCVGHKYVKFDVSSNSKSSMWSARQNSSLRSSKSRESIVSVNSDEGALKNNYQSI